MLSFKNYVTEEALSLHVAVYLYVPNSFQTYKTVTKHTIFEARKDPPLRVICVHTGETTQSSPVKDVRLTYFTNIRSQCNAPGVNEQV